MSPGELARIIDHTLLRPDATADDVDAHCRQGVEHGFASVCVNPTWVARCARALVGRRVAVGTVVGFPLGAATAAVKRYEAEAAIGDGATEIDVVINVGALRSGDLALVGQDMEGVTAVCREAGSVSKVIIEAALLTEREKVAACEVAMRVGADFVKTSTGFGPGGATASDVKLMRRVVGESMGVKAAGGIRTLGAVREMVAAGASRIGSSAGVSILQELTAEQAARGAAVRT